MGGGHKNGLLTHRPTQVAFVVLFAVGFVLGMFAPVSPLPHPVFLLPLALLLLDTGLSALIAAREHRTFSGYVHFVLLLAFVTMLYVVGAFGGVRTEVIVIVPLAVRIILLLTRLY
jgi:hypothetical protein